MFGCKVEVNSEINTNTRNITMYKNITSSCVEGFLRDDRRFSSVLVIGNKVTTYYKIIKIEVATDQDKFSLSSSYIQIGNSDDTETLSRELLESVRSGILKSCVTST
ncbi:hypothetical protein CRN44_05650 [Vibrio vulnificus]|nr:hypothetical protein CRN45_06335 [Vibrio vulnificus]POC65594.1 hypothetical protein CRN44_05650 [Vibrio vulnificus]